MAIANKLICVAAATLFILADLAAQHHFAEERTMKGFRDWEYLRMATAAFKELTGWR